MRWRIRAFGALEAECAKNVVTRFESRKVGALLVYLAWRCDRLHPRETLVELLWPEEPLDVGRARFRQALSSLRGILEPPGVRPGTILVADRLQAGLAPGCVTTDLAEFETSLAAAAHGSVEERAAALTRADELCRGELLPGYYDEWILAERQRLAEAHREALGQLGDLEAARGDLSGAIAHARRTIRLDPLDEEGHRRLIRLLLEQSRPDDALRQYRSLEQTLREELDASPAPATRRLLEAIDSARREGAVCVPARPALVLPAAARVALEPVGGAVPLGSPFYIRREADDELEAALLRRDSIVLVKGPRQVGKTSLLARGLELAREAGARVFLTDLQALTEDQLRSTDQLFRTVAEAMAEELELDRPARELWNPERSWNVNLQRFLRQERWRRTSRRWCGAWTRWTACSLP